VCLATLVAASGMAAVIYGAELIGLVLSTLARHLR